MNELGSAIELSLFSSQVESVCDEMGAVLMRSAFSANIKDRLDFSCAVFDGEGNLVAQAAHIPVHMGSMAYAMADLVSAVDWQEGDMLVVNDPFKGGTHLPDVTMITPVFASSEDIKPIAFVVNRAHHAHIGASAPGSMPISKHIDEEGLLISPVKIMESGSWNQECLQTLVDSLGGKVELSAVSNGNSQTVDAEQEAVLEDCEELGDFLAQISANKRGLSSLSFMISRCGVQGFKELVGQLNEYAFRIAKSSLSVIPKGEFSFEDYLDGDGMGTTDIPIRVTITHDDEGFFVDFSASSTQVAGNLNCSLPVTAASVFYVFRCLMPKYTPNSAGLFRYIRIRVADNSVLNAQWPAAVAAGNVETSMRIVDVLLGALAKASPDLVPAASHGSMNNLAMGMHRTIENDETSWNYYETIGGGMGAHADGEGPSAVQCHMTNTLNTPVESLEMHYPLRIERYGIRRGSGGIGLYNGGNGIVRSYRFLKPTKVTILSERRQHAPWGLGGASAGAEGKNFLNGAVLDGKVSFEAVADDLLEIETPGGGGYGSVI